MSSRSAAVFIAFLSAALPLSCLAEAPAKRVLVPAGTQVPVHIVGTLASNSAKADQTFQIQVASDVTVHGIVVFAKGAAGEGHVVNVDSAGGNGHSGSLELAFDYVYSMDGGRVRLTSSPQKQAEEDRKGASSTATIIGYATLGIGGLFGHNFAHGRDKTLDEKTVMNAFVGSNVHVKSSESAEEAPQYDK